MFGKGKYVRIIAAIVALIVIVSVAYAAFFTVDTTDNRVDTDWSATAFLTDGDDYANDDYDIVEAWIGNDGENPTEFYFRVQLANAGQLPAGGDALEARLDCSDPANGLYTDPEDIIVYYSLNGATESIVECQGSDYYECDFAASNTSDTNPNTYGEEITFGAPPYNYEWKADVTGGDTDWSNCLGEISVEFASVDSDAIKLDDMQPRGYNVPTSVTLSSLLAGANGSALLLVPAGVLVFGAALGGLFVVRRRKNR